MRFVLTALIAVLLLSGCGSWSKKVPAEVQFVRDEAARFQQYNELTNRQKEDAAATQSFIKWWGDTICKKRDQQLIAFGDRVGCGTQPIPPPVPQPKPPEKK